MKPTVHTLSIHEAGHAVVGIAAGIGPKLEEVSILWDEENRPGCTWNEAPLDNEETQVAVSFGGPLAQCILYPESLGPDPDPFALTINQAPEILIARGLGGWLGNHGADGDLRSFLYRSSYPRMERILYPASPLEFIEQKTRELLSLPRPSGAVAALAKFLRERGAVPGQEVLALVRYHLTPEDYVTEDYFRPTPVPPPAALA